MKVNFTRGDIVTLDFDPSLGNEIQGNPRPAIVISSRDFHSTGFAMVCPITRGEASIARKNAFAVSLMGTGCRTDGNIVAYQARIIDYKARNLRKVEAAPAHIIDQVQDIIDSIVHD